MGVKKRIRKIGWIALAVGVVAALVVPLVVPVETTGTQTEEQAAGESATFVDIEGVGVHYVTRDYTGEGTDQPLFVLLHGFGASTYSWREVIDDIASFGDVVAYDRPAFGLTKRPTSWEGESPYGVDAQMDVLQGVIDAFANEGQAVVVVGHSAGGTLAAEFGLRYPDRVDALVLVAPAILSTGGGPSWITPLLSIPQIDRIGPLLVAGIATSGDELLERSWHDVSLLTPEIREAYRLPLTISGWERAFWEFQKAPRNFLISENPGALTPPTSIITGDDDRVVQTADSIALAELIPGSQLHVLAESGHLPHEETPEAFMEALEASLQAETMDVLAHAALVEPVVTEVLAEIEYFDADSVDCELVPCVALTFDDGPGTFTAEIIDILAEYEATATFYVVGKQVRRWPSMLPLIVESGHELGNHTMTHPYLSTLSAEDRRDQVDDLDNLIHSLVGFYPPTLRPPYGDIPATGIPDQHLRPVVTWSVDALDWRKRSPGRIAKTVLDQVGPGDVILMHEIASRSVDALPAVLAGLQERGLRVVGLSQLIGRPGAGQRAIESVAFVCPAQSEDPGVLYWCTDLASTASSSR